VTLHRFFVASDLPADPACGVDLAFSESDRHHLVRVLRLGPGDRIAVAGPDGREAEATLVSATVDAVVADIDRPLARGARPRVALAPALSRRERMELVMQKATELGVVEVVPFASSRCVVKLDAERSGKRADRWRRIVEEAAKQSQRADVPLVREPASLEDLAAELGRFDVVLLAWEDAAHTSMGIGQALDAAGAGAGTSVLLVIGPEGGLAESEVALLEAAGAAVVTLGETVLRTETAAIVACAVAIYELGGLGGRGR
jgi:16S rRNA (uracil1498-N3)-methyltransferase